MKAVFSLLLVGLALIAIASFQWGKAGAFWAATVVAILLVAFCSLLVILTRIGQALSDFEPDPK